MTSVRKIEICEREKSITNPVEWIRKYESNSRQCRMEKWRLEKVLRTLLSPIKLKPIPTEPVKPYYLSHTVFEIFFVFENKIAPSRSDKGANQI